MGGKGSGRPKLTVQQTCERIETKMTMLEEKIADFMEKYEMYHEASDELDEYINAFSTLVRYDITTVTTRPR